MFDEFPKDERPFLEAITAKPGDLDVRRIYADWLDERGDPRGACLRLEYEIEEARRKCLDLPAIIESCAELLDRSWTSTVGLRYAVLLQTCGPNKLGAIKVVKEATRLGLKQCIEIVKSVPTTVGASSTFGDADFLVRRFREVGAIASIIPAHDRPE